MNICHTSIEHISKTMEIQVTFPFKCKEQSSNSKGAGNQPGVWLQSKFLLSAVWGRAAGPHLQQALPRSLDKPNGALMAKDLQNPNAPLMPTNNPSRKNRRTTRLISKHGTAGNVLHWKINAFGAAARKRKETRNKTKQNKTELYLKVRCSAGSACLRS